MQKLWAMPETGCMAGPAGLPGTGDMQKLWGDAGDRPHAGACGTLQRRQADMIAGIPASI